MGCCAAELKIYNNIVTNIAVLRCEIGLCRVKNAE